MVKARQAQYYMNAAQGKAIPVRKLANTQPAAYLENTASAATDWTISPAWTPSPGCWYMAVWDKAHFFVVPSVTNPGYFHVSKLYDDVSAKPDPLQPDWDGVSLYQGTKRPVIATFVEETLKYQGMAEPSKIDWSEKKRTGLPRPFGEPQGDGSICT